MISKSEHGQLLFKAQVTKITNLSIQTLRRMWLRKAFPKPLLVNNRCCWRLTEIEAWLDALGGRNNG